MVNQCRQALIESIKRNQNAFFLILNALSCTQIHTQHRTLSVRNAFSRTAEQSNRIQNLAEQVELIRNKRINIRKILCTLKMLHFQHFARKLDNRIKRIHLFSVNRFQFCLRCIILFQDALLDDLRHITGGQR